jgi:ATP-dependent DNA helicase RecQ
VESALRILRHAKAIVGNESSMSLVSVRLLATPQRIKRELTGDANTELGLLRAMWRVAGDALNNGATIDLDSLPPGLSTRSQATATLDALQSRQFLVWQRVGGGLRMTSPGAPLSQFKVDWASIDRRRNAELSKLEAVQRYAYTKVCRRGFVLRYFGDPAARHKCDGCDNCLGITRTREPALKAGRKSARRKTLVKDVSDNDDVSLTKSELETLSALRKKRGEIARRDGVPAYIVFSDRTLAEMALKRPRSLAAMSSVHGVGAMKLERYGVDFLEVIKSVDETEAA